MDKKTELRKIALNEARRLGIYPPADGERGLMIEGSPQVPDVCAPDMTTAKAVAATNLMLDYKAGADGAADGATRVASALPGIRQGSTARTEFLVGKYGALYSHALRRRAGHSWDDDQKLRRKPMTEDEIRRIGDYADKRLALTTAIAGDQRAVENAHLSVCG